MCSVALRVTQRAPAELKLQYIMKEGSVSSFKSDEIDENDNACGSDDGGGEDPFRVCVDPAVHM